MYYFAGQFNSKGSFYVCEVEGQKDRKGYVDSYAFEQCVEQTKLVSNPCAVKTASFVLEYYMRRSQFAKPMFGQIVQSKFLGRDKTNLKFLFELESYERDFKTLIVDVHPFSCDVIRLKNI
jgi:hypothetical protein